MPLRRRAVTAKRRSRRKRVRFATGKRRSRFRSRRSNGSTLVIKNSQLPFPKRTLAKLEGTLEGTIATATTFPVKYAFYGNDVLYPFNFTPAFAAVAFPNTYQTKTTLNFPGVNQYLTSGLGVTGAAQGIYNCYKVHGVSIALESTPEFAYGGTGSQSQQLFEVSAFPLKNQSGRDEVVGSSGLNQIDPASISNLPYSKTIQISQTQTKANTLKKYWSIRQLYGLTKEQWRNADIVQYATTSGINGPFTGGRNNSPQQSVNIMIMYKCGNPSQTSNNYPISYKLKVRMYVEFFNPIVSQYPIF